MSLDKVTMANRAKYPIANLGREKVGGFTTPMVDMFCGGGPYQTDGTSSYSGKFFSKRFDIMFSSATHKNVVVGEVILKLETDYTYPLTKISMVSEPMGETSLFVLGWLKVVEITVDGNLSNQGTIDTINKRIIDREKTQVRQILFTPVAERVTSDTVVINGVTFIAPKPKIKF